MVNVSEFKREYIKALQEGTAAVFVGAGLSRPSGFVDWRGLLRELARDINLDVDKEEDLISLAQYYANSRGGRGGVNQRILDSFTKGIKNNSSINNLINLPIDTYWTTNYDTLIEDALRHSGKIVDIKIRPESLAVSKKDRDAIVYKMHGDVNDTSFCVITKDDYESYNLSRQLFTTALQGDLVTKTFLFVGFSLDDPNINYILGKIRILLGENARPHY
jgi:NAD-dependent SIR2 family protein deacetylase